MMSFKLSIKNIKKSMKDYAIYFLTLILGVAIFYVFNALDSQTAMKGLSKSGYQLVQLMVNMLGFVSVLVAFILGFLIVYANSFLIKRRKKEFGVYMLLGMGKGGISRILFGETIVIGILSLTVGLLLGVFASQFMSILVVKLFEADMTSYSFTVSTGAIQKTIIYFSVMYLIVLIFNAFAVTKYKLVDLFIAGHKGERETMKNSKVAVLVFILAAGILGYAYYQVGFCANTITIEKATIMIILGCIGTFLTFWSLSGFLLKLLQRFKRIYHKNLNAFILRQLSNNMNTAVFSMTVICLLLFATICAFCSGMSMNSALNNELKEMTPVDFCMVKQMDLPDDGSFSDETVANSQKTVAQMLNELGLTEEMRSENCVEISTYLCDGLNFSATLGAHREEAISKFPMLDFECMETLVSQSDYNKIAKLYGKQEIFLEDNQYALVCNFENMQDIRNSALKDETSIQVGDYTLHPFNQECTDGFIEMAPSGANTGIFIIPDALLIAELGKAVHIDRNLMAGDYAADSKEGKEEIESVLTNLQEDQVKKYRGADGSSKISIQASSTGLAVVITFVVLYIGIIFLISGAAILALKSLSDTADSKERYEILQKIGADEKLMNKALLSQLSLFFVIPLLFAMIHSVFGMRFVSYVLAVFNQGDMLNSIGLTGLLLLIVYGSYFLATYIGSKRMIEEKQ